jgi:nitronate monooxygenase
MRAAAKAAGDPDRFHLWAGQAHARSRPIPAASLVDELVEEARAALASAPGLRVD